MQINSPLPHPTAAEPKNADPVRTHARARTPRQIVDEILEITGGCVVTELRMVRWTLYKIAGARLEDVEDCAPEIRHALLMLDGIHRHVTVTQQVYHIHLEVWLYGTF